MITRRTRIQLAIFCLITLLGGVIDESHARWHTFDEFTYFQHFTPDQIKKGIYSDLASLQGHDATFYVPSAGIVKPAVTAPAIPDTDTT